MYGLKYFTKQGLNVSLHAQEFSYLLQAFANSPLHVKVTFKPWYILLLNLLRISIE